MKKSLITLFILCYSMVAFCQKEPSANLLKADSTWIKEIIPFPIGFAQELDYEGIEEIRFAPGWAKEDSPELWSYVFVWHVSFKKDPTAKDLEKEMQLYFDGLMSPGDQAPEAKAVPTTALIIETETGKADSNYIGKIRTFDRFRSKQMMTLNLSVEKHYCEDKNINIIFRFSPKEFDHDVWNKLKTVKLHANSCDF